MKQKNLWVVVLIGGILLGILIGLLINILMNQKIVIEDNREKPLYEDIINRFADTHTYNISTYNCVNYSEDLGFILNNLGYETEQLTTENVNETTNEIISRHRKLLLILEIEPQNGEIGVKKNEP